MSADKDDPPMWWMNGRNVYNGDDYGSLIAECTSCEIAFAMVEAGNSDPEFRRGIRDAK